MNLLPRRHHHKAASATRALVLMLLVTAPVVCAGDSCLLVQDGQPRATIVVAAKPTRVGQFAAAELSHYAQKLAGAALPIVTEDTLTAEQAANDLVLVGESERTRQLGLTNAALKPQEHIIRNAGRWLVLMGRDEEECGPVDYAKDCPWPECRLDFPRRVQFKHWGSFYAVDTFLERVCGVRWYMPGELGEVAPKTATIRARGLNLRLKPWTKYRVIGHTWAWDPFDFYAPGRDPKKMLPQREMLLWWLRMKLGGEPFNVNHSVYSYFDRFADAHPDWFADGKPVRGGHLCYTHPGFVAQHAQDARDYFDSKYPTMLFPKGGQVPAAGDYYPAVPIDSSSGWCSCPRCRALLEVNRPIVEDIPGASFFNGRYSEYVWTFANAVAREVRKTHPDKRISAIAYARYFRPPQHVTLEPNLSVGVTKQVMLYGNPKAKQYFNDTLREWHARVGELYIWEYYLNQYFNKFCAFPWITPRLIGEDIEFLKTVGVVGKFVETSPWKSRRANLAEDLLPVYITAKLLADDSRSVGEILDEHYRLFYGPAAAPMKAFYEKIEAIWRNTTIQAHKAGGQRLSWEWMCPPRTLKEFHALMTQAVALARVEPYATRIRLMNEAIYQPMEKQCLEYAERSKSRRRMACPLISAPPVMDGKLGDAAWKQAARTPPLVGMTAEKVEVDTVAYVARDERMLYVALDCPEPEMNKLVANHNKPDSLEVCLDDDVEVFVDVGRTREKYYHLLANPNGTLADRAVGMGLDEGGIGWNSGAKVATARSDRGWTIEMAIPLQSLNAAPKPGDVWGFNACRVRRGAVKDLMGQTTCWSPTFGGFNTPDEFGTLEMAASVSAAGRGDSLTPVIAFNFEEPVANNASPLPTGPGLNGVTATAQRLQMGGGKLWNESCQGIGKSGRGCVFDAAAQRYISVQLPEALGLARGDFTAMLWLKTASNDSQSLLGSTTSPPFWILAINKIGEKRLLRFLMGTGPPTTVVNADAPPADDRWHHVAVTVDRGKLATVFLDGEPQSVADISHHKGAFKPILTVGGPYNSFSGSVDTVQVYRGALSPADIKALYQRQQSDNGEPGK